MKHTLLILILVLLIALPVSAEVVREREMSLEGDIDFLTGAVSGDKKVGTKIYGTGSVERSEVLTISEDEGLNFSLQMDIKTDEEAIRKLKVIQSMMFEYGVYADMITPDKGETGFLAQELLINDGFSLEQVSGVVGEHRLHVELSNEEAILFDDMVVRGRTRIKDFVMMSLPEEVSETE